MDALDIFRKLSAGAKFNKKTLFQENKKTVSEVKKVKKEKDRNSFIDEIGAVDSKVKSEVVSDSESVGKDPVTLLGGIKFQGKPNKKEKKKRTEADREQEEINHKRKKNHISVTGKNVPKPVETFQELELYISPQIVDNLLSVGYSEPTPIQMQAIPAMIAGRQILACAPTGSGKTAAFLVPVLHTLGKPRRDGFRALIVCPTRELARQIFRECHQLSEGTGLRAHLISKISQKNDKLGPNFSKKFDILITTPNRLIYMLNQEIPINLTTVEWLIIDESDKLFEVGVRGFREQLADIYKACNSTNLKRAMFSATYTTHVAKWCRKNLKGLVTVTVGHRNTAVDLVEQKLLFVGSEHGKLIEIRNLIHEGLHPPVLIFVQSKDRAKELFNELIYDGINVDIIHADRTQLQRDNVVRAFREGKIWVLICTELMGRGIDFKGINLVINYDFPQSAISYIHRIGRTGRAGRPGKAITFFTEADKPTLRSIATVMRDSGCEVPEYMLGLKRVHKRVKRKLEHSVPQRESISTKPMKRTLWKSKPKGEESPNKKPKLNSKHPEHRWSKNSTETSPKKWKKTFKQQDNPNKKFKRKFVHNSKNENGPQKKHKKKSVETLKK